MKPVVFVGFPGAGKSSVAREFAPRWGGKLIDLDVEIERRAGRSITDLIRVEGESRFRDLESDVLAEVAGLLVVEGSSEIQSKRLVVSAGGGVVLRERNREIVRDHMLAVWLDASPKVLLRRVVADERTAEKNGGGVKRPLLRLPRGPGIEENASPLGEAKREVVSEIGISERLERLRAERGPLFSGLGLKIRTDFAEADEIARELVRVFKLLDAVVGYNETGSDLSAVISVLVPVRGGGVFYSGKRAVEGVGEYLGEVSESEIERKFNSK